jgi:hypothetical protein
MKIYFTASIVGKKHFLTNYQKIISILEKHHHRVKSDHIINVSENQINMQSKPDREKFHKKLKKWIMDSDCVIVETSFPSISVGFEISLALNLGKPVLLLYTNEAPTLLSSYNDEKLLCEKYTSETLIGIVEDFINYAEGKCDQRFTFFISPTIGDYLEAVSRRKRIPKSVYLRRLIEKDISKPS